MAVPRHERDRHVRAERELAASRSRAVGEDVAGLHLLAELHERTLVDRRVLVGAPVLLDPVAVVLREARQRRSSSFLPRSVGAGVDDDLVGRDARDDAGAARDDHRARVARHLLLEARADERRLRD